MIVLQILLAILILYIVFIAGPALTFYLSIFGRRKGRSPEEEAFDRDYRAPYIKDIRESAKFFSSLKGERIGIDSNGAVLYADWFFSGSDKTAVVFHGYNSEPYLNVAAQARWLYEHGYNALIPYMRAHSISGGRHSGLGLLEKEDVILWLEKARELSNTDRILAYGVSMGASSIAMASDDERFSKLTKAMILDCGYDSVYEQLVYNSKLLRLPYPLTLPPVELMCRLLLGINVKDTTMRHLSSCSTPALFIHGDNDATVPYQSSVKNYEACSSEKYLVIVEDAPHTCAFIHSEKARKAVKDFTDKYI